MNDNEIWIYDIIGYEESTAKVVAIQQERADQTKPLVVRINSDGGIVTEGYGIYNTLRRHKAGVQVEIDGIAASAASLIAMAGDAIRIADGAFLMIHQSWGRIIGNKEEMPKEYEKAIQTMTNIDQTMAKRYAERTGLPVERIDEMLRAETWITSSQAVEMGFADELMNEARAIPYVEEGKWDYKNTPRELLVSPMIAGECRDLKKALAVMSNASPEKKQEVSSEIAKQRTAIIRVNHFQQQIRLSRSRLGV